MSDFFRFPSTPHIAWLGTGMPRDDKVLSVSQAADLLREYECFLREHGSEGIASH